MKSSSARAGFRGILENMFGQFEIRDNAPCYGHYRETGTGKILWNFVECMRNIPRQCDIMRISVILMGGIHLDNANNSAVTVIKYGDFFF